MSEMDSLERAILKVATTRNCNVTIRRLLLDFYRLLFFQHQEGVELLCHLQ